MRRAVILSLVVALITLAGEAQAFDVKPGLWEVTTTNQMSGAPTIPESMLSKMTPEQRERFESAMKQQMTPHQNTHKTCVTQEKIDNLFKDKREGSDCRRNITTNTASHVAFTETCSGGREATITGDFHALGSKSVIGTIHIVASDNGRTMKGDGRFSGRWIGANCGSAADTDE